MPKYSDFFYKRYAQGSSNSAEVVVPMVIDLINPNSVVDVGCGIGTWLSVYEKLGVKKVLGIDGAYVNQGSLLFQSSDFLALDLSQPKTLDETFDLVQSLEVAEHLAEDKADGFVDFLTSLGPVVLFSAAIPGQPGKYHVNTKWPDYWASKFKARGYVVIDCIRGDIWANKKVAWWYAQNILLFIKEEALSGNAKLSAKFLNQPLPALRRRHPKWYGIQFLKISGLFIAGIAAYLSGVL